MQNTNLISMPNREMLPNPETPWMMSKEVFQRLQGPNSSYKKCEITSNDREWLFVQSYFASHPPENRHIGRIHCIHTPESIKAFEAKILTSEKEAGELVFAPKWDQEPEGMLRQRVSNRWNMMANQYSPFTMVGKDNRLDKYHKVKILPLWHGSTAAKSDSICKTGFTLFGNHALLQGGANPGQKTDAGYFGNGIYFTNSARYAADVYSDGNLLLAWVSMREPYPVVADCEYPNRPKDSKKLEALGNYENYNAHHIPVISIDPANKKCQIYYPCTANQEPVFDEIVVFNNAQTLTRFWVKLEVTLVKPLSPSTETIGKLLDKVLELLEHPEIKQNSELKNLLKTKWEALLYISGKTPLDHENLAYYQSISRLIDSAGKVRSFVAEELFTLSNKTALPPLIADSVPAGIPTWKKVALVGLCIFIIVAPMMAIFGVPFFLPGRNPLASHEASNGDICIGDQYSVQPYVNHLSMEPVVLPHIPIGSKVEIVSTTEKVVTKEVKPEELKSRQEIKLPTIAFGASKWNKYFGDVGVESPLPLDIEAKLNRQCPFWPDKKVRDTHLLVFIPETVNRNPFTLNSLEELIQNPKEGHKTGYAYYNPNVKEEIGHKWSISRSYWFLLTREVIPTSRNTHYYNQEKIVKDYAKKSSQPYQLPTALEVATGILIDYVQTGNKLYNYSFTRCQNIVTVYDWPVFIGGFAYGDGLNLGCEGLGEDDYVGVGACLRL